MNRGAAVTGRRGVLFRRAVTDRRRWMVGWSIGITAFVIINIAFWPSFADQADEMNDMLDDLPESLKSLFGMGGGVDLFSPVGYLSAQIYALMLPLLLLLAAVSAAGAVAGDEDQGLLETTFSLPVSRRQVLLERWAAVIATTGALAGAALVSVAVMVAIVDLGVGFGALLWATCSAALLTWAFAGVALAAGAWSGRKGVATATAAVLATAMYVVTGLAQAGIAFFEVLEPVSLFTHYDVLHSLQHGTPPWSVLVLVVVTLAGPAVAAWAIDRRDLRAG